MIGSMKARSRLPHNYNHKRYRSVTGKYFYVKKNSRQRIIYALVATILAGFIISTFDDGDNSVSSTFSPPVEAANTIEIRPAIISSPTPTPTEREQIINYIVEVFGEDAPLILNILWCENRNLDPKAVNYNRNQTTDHSVMQINSIHLTGKEFKECIGADSEWKTNIKCGKAIYNKYGASAWACSSRVGITPFWKE